MAENGVQSTYLTAVSEADEVLVNKSGATGRQAVSKLGSQLLKTSALGNIGILSGSQINIAADKVNYAPIANLIRATGDSAYNTLYGPQREIQSFAADEINRKYYTLHENDQPTNLAIICRYPMDGAGIDRTQDAMSTANAELGHQGLDVEYLTTGAIKLWCTDGTDKFAAIRFDFANGSGPLNKQKFVFFSAAQGFNSDVSCFDGFSYDKRLTIAHGLLVGQQRMICRVWDTAALIQAGPGDHTEDFLFEFDMGDLYAPTTNPIQGVTSDGASLFGLSGGNGFAVAPRRMYKYAGATGKILEGDHNVMIGSTEAAADGTGISYEPEGLRIMNVGGQPRLCLGVRSGSSLTPSIFRIHAMGMNQRADHNVRASGIVAVFRRLGVVIGNIFVNTVAMAIRASGSGVNLRLGTGDADQWEIQQSDGRFQPMTSATVSLGSSTRRILDGWINKIIVGDEIRFDGATTNQGLIQKNASTGRGELQIYAAGDAYQDGSRGAGMHLYDNEDDEHAGNIAFMTGQNDLGDGRMIISGGSSNSGSAGYRTNTDTRITIGNGIFNFVDSQADTAMLNLRSPIGRPALNISNASAGDISVSDGERLDLGHWSGTAFTLRMGINSAGNIEAGSDNTQSLGTAGAGWATVNTRRLQFGGSTAPIWLPGSGSPEGNITAPPGSKYARTDTPTTVNQREYWKATGTGNTGWVAIF